MNPWKETTRFHEEESSRLGIIKRGYFPAGYCEKWCVIVASPQTPLHLLDGEGQGRGRSKRMDYLLKNEIYNSKLHSKLWGGFIS